MSTEIRPSRMSLEERSALLDRAWKLRDDHAHSTLIEMLGSVASAEIELEPQLGYLLADALYRVGRWEPALELTRRVEAGCRRNGNTRLARRQMNLEGMILSSMGDLEGAKLAYNSALAAASEAGDELIVADVHNNLAVIADQQCRWDEALSNYQRAMPAFQRCGHPFALGSIHHNLGMCYRQLGLYSKAGDHFQHALFWYRSSGSDIGIAVCEVERALLLWLMGDYRLAEATARRTLDSFVRLAFPSGEGNALRVLGMVASGQDRDAEARAFFDEGLVRVQAAGDRMTEAEIREELAVLEEKQRNGGASVAMATEADRIYREMGTPARAERVWRRLEEEGSESVRMNRSATGSA